MARLHPEIRAAAEQFVLLRIGNMRGVDLSIFDFDYDLSWFAMMLTTDGVVLGRFGGRDADTPGKYQTLSGLRHSLETALNRFKLQKNKKPAARKSEFAEDYPAAAKRSDNACIHCHHVYEFRRDAMQQDKRWSLDELWVYPQPENIGLTLAPQRGDHVTAVQPGSQAELNLRPKDVLTRIGDAPIASVADVQYALQLARTQKELTLAWQRDGKPMNGTIQLPDKWRHTDLSWRWSLKSMSPNPSIIGDDLSAEDRKSLGLDPNQLAYRHMNFLTPPARHAGLRANDVIIGVDDTQLSMTARQFETHIRLNYRAGQEITLNVLRGKDKMKLKMKLPE